MPLFKERPSLSIYGSTACPTRVDLSNYLRMRLVVTLFLLAFYKVHESLSSTAVAPENSTCHATKRLYIDRACCGAQSNRAAICTAPNVNLSAIGTLDTHLDHLLDIKERAGLLQNQTDDDLEVVEAEEIHDTLIKSETWDSVRYFDVQTSTSTKRLRVIGTEVFHGNQTVKVALQSMTNPCVPVFIYVHANTTAANAQENLSGSLSGRRLMSIGTHRSHRGYARKSRCRRSRRCIGRYAHRRRRSLTPLQRHRLLKKNCETFINVTFPTYEAEKKKCETFVQNYAEYN